MNEEPVSAICNAPVDTTIILHSRRYRHWSDEMREGVSYSFVAFL